jgi:hypothetical protein
LRKHRPDSFDSESHDGAGPQNRGHETNADQQDGEIHGRLTDKAAHEFRHSFTKSGRHAIKKAFANADGNPF